MHNKVKITKKAASESTPCLLSVGYCRIQTLLQHLRPFAYSAGVHGWLCDYFDVADGVVISTGYAHLLNLIYAARRGTSYGGHPIY